MRYLGLCAIAKNESVYLREWVAHHYSLGFERFFIYDNGSDEPIRDTLRDYVDKGVVEVLDALGDSMQIPCYADCLERRRGEVRWLAFLDLDEFLILKQERDARLLLADYEQYGGLAVHWAPFGSAGHLRRPEDLVLNAYTERFNKANWDLHVKSIVRTDRCTGMRDPHQALFRDNFHLVDENGLPVVSALFPHCSGRVQLNHYMFKSQQEYEEKIARGRSDVAALSGSRTWEQFRAQSVLPVYEERIPAAHLRILRLAVEKRSLVRYLDVDSEELDSLPLYLLTERVTACLLRRHPEEAELLVECARPRFSGVPEFLALAVMTAIQCKKFDRALQDVYARICLEPGAEAFYQLFLLHVAMRQLERAREVGRYIVGTARAFKHDLPDLLEKLRETDTRLQLGIF